MRATTTAIWILATGLLGAALGACGEGADSPDGTSAAPAAAHVHEPDCLFELHELSEDRGGGRIEVWRCDPTALLPAAPAEISLGEIGPFTNGDLAFHQQHGHRLMAWSPLGGGRLMTEDSAMGRVADEIAAAQGVDRAAVAVAFLLAHPAGIVPVMGTNSLARIARLSDALTVTLDRQTWYRLYEAALGTEVP